MDALCTGTKDGPSLADSCPKSCPGGYRQIVFCQVYPLMGISVGSRVNETSVSRYPILERLAPSTFGDDAWIWNVSALMGQYGLKGVVYKNQFGEGR